ncbi:SusC/RagA family TonB-linked outer membrane protein [Marinilabiliaceae bacterium JC017]|nr:SusC/RagA family TonB-linked outer membrane protein [Marinilabiliaceae bacterium JC017]
MKKNRLRSIFSGGLRVPGSVSVKSWLVLLLVFSSFQLYANGFKKLNLSLKDASIEQVFTAIENQSNFRFLYKTDLVDVDKKVTIRVKDAGLESVLAEVFAGTGINYSVRDGGLVVITPVSAYVDEQQHEKVVKGRVVDVHGESLPGVAVFLKADNSVGTITDIEGNYQLTFNQANAVIMYSFIGMEVVEVPYNGQPSIDITMVSSVQEMDEVVVVAYGTTQKSNLTGSVAALKGEELKDVTTPSVATALQGKASGVYVSNASGKPGETAKIRIRGKSSLNTSVDPLWVIDGVVAGTGVSLNPGEIESMSVLKDASATALYGSRAANGVIMVTTKSGKVGQSQLSFNASTGITQLTNGKFSMMNSQELYDSQKDWEGDTRNWFNEDLLKTDFDWFDNASQTGVAQDYTLSYQGGTDKVKTYIMGGYYNETGAVKGYEFEKYNFRTNLDYKVNDKLTLKSKVAASYKHIDDRQHSTHSMYYYLPWDTPYYADGTIRNPQDKDLEKANEMEWYGRDGSNYMYDNQFNWGKTNVYGGQINLDFEYRFNDHFTFVSTNNVGIRVSESESYTDLRSNAGQADKGKFDSYTSRSTTRFTNQLLRYQTSFGEHNVKAFAAYEYSDYFSKSLNGLVGGIAPGMEVPDVGAEAMKVEGGKWDTKMQSVLFNGNYIFKNRYMAQFSIRTDGSSKFGPDNRYGTFLTGSLGWTISDEAFMSDVSWVDMLKLRASYGSLGNTPNAYYGYQGLYSMKYQYNGIPAAFPSQLKNEGLTWEKTISTNLAVDARLFNRLGISVELYDKNTTDLLYYVRLATMTGYRGYYDNIGKVNNKGLEIVLSPEVIKSAGFNWNLDFNIGFNRNEVKSVYEGKSYKQGDKIVEEGENMDTWYMPKWAGVDPANGNPLWEQVIEHDDNKDGKTDREEVVTTTDYNKATLQKVGCSAPDFYGGLLSTMSYKAFTLNANFAFVYGNDIYHQAREMYDSDGAYPTFNSMKLKDGWSRWEKPGDNATHPKSYFMGNNLSNKTSSRYLEDGSYLRLKNVTLAYQVPQSFCKKIGFGSARLFVSGDNLWTLTDFSGIDPEVGVDEEGETEGWANAIYPQTRKFMFGVSVNF